MKRGDVCYGMLRAAACVSCCLLLQDTECGPGDCRVLPLLALVNGTRLSRWFYIARSRVPRAHELLMSTIQGVVYYCRTYMKAGRGGGVKRGDVRYGMLRAAACVDESDHHALMYVYLNCSKKLKLVISCGGCCHQPDRGPRILHTPTPTVRVGAARISAHRHVRLTQLRHRAAPRRRESCTRRRELHPQQRELHPQQRRRTAVALGATRDARPPGFTRVLQGSAAGSPGFTRVLQGSAAGSPGFTSPAPQRQMCCCRCCRRGATTGRKAT